MFKIEKQFEDFFKMFTECKDCCNSKRMLCFYYENKSKISN